MNDTADRTFAVGDTVAIDHPKCPGLFKVIDKLPKNYRCEPLGGGRAIRVSPELMLPATDEGNGVIGVPYVPPVFFDCGQTVSLKGKPGIFVVLKSTPRGYSVAVLGGEGGRYWNVPTSGITAINVKAEVID